MRRVLWKIGSLLVLVLASSAMPRVEAASEIGAAKVYSVIEILFTGPAFSSTDSPAKDVDFWVRLKHESGAPIYKIHGFWDGDGRGGAQGNVFKVRFCPTRVGRWNLVEVHSNRRELLNQREGDYVSAARSTNKGFWIVDETSAGRRWYVRSDGSHQYIYGNTHYSFLSETYLDGKPSGSNIAKDVTGNAEHFKKLRFSPIGDLYPHPTAAPFLTDAGAQTYDGDNSHRPNPAWFHNRVDVAVRTAFEDDLIADIIISGVDLETTRAALRAANNKGDPTPYLKYIAARYGAYPNVWFCLINEYDIRTPKFTPAQVAGFGKLMQSFLAYPNPLSVHRASGPWRTELNTTPSWNDHVIFQLKRRDLSEAADAARHNHVLGGANKPIVNDELSYQGAGDEHSEEDTIESHLGAFLGGSYGSTGHKTGGGSRQRMGSSENDGNARPIPGNKTGQYFAGNFSAAEHTAADNLLWLRQKIDAHVTFWRLAPIDLRSSVFPKANPEFRVMGWAGNEYVLGTDEAQAGITAHLPVGTWIVKQFDVIAKKETTLTTSAIGDYHFDAPASRAVLFHFIKKTGTRSSRRKR